MKHPNKFALMAMVNENDYEMFNDYRKKLSDFVEFFMEKDFVNDVAPQHISLVYFSYPDKYSESYVKKFLPVIKKLIQKYITLTIKVKGLNLDFPVITWNIIDYGNVKLLRKELIKELSPHFKHLLDMEKDFKIHVGVALAKKENLVKIKEIIDGSKKAKEQVLRLDKFYIYFEDKPEQIKLDNKIKIIEPSKELFDIANKYIKLIKNLLPESKICLIGSLAVPMCGKEEIDLLIETKDVKKAQEIVSKIGFSVGPIVDGEGFCKGRNFSVECDLHIVSNNHKKIKKYFGLINKLKENPDLFKKYESFKKSLNGSTIREYKSKKNKFLIENGLV